MDKTPPKGVNPEAWEEMYQYQKRRKFFRVTRVLGALATTLALFVAFTMSMGWDHEMFTNNWLGLVIVFVVMVLFYASVGGIWKLRKNYGLDPIADLETHTKLESLEKKEAE